MSPERRQPVTNRSWLVPLAVGLLTFVAFLPALRAGFVAWDDQSNFLENVHYRGLGLDQLRWMWTTFLLGHYVPLSWMTLGLDYVVWGMNPAGYHFTSLLIHSVNAVLLYFVARRLLRLSGVLANDDETARLNVAAALAALLFSIHPLRAESVVWVTERRDVLSGFFYLCTLLGYLRHVEREARPGKWYWLALAAFICALLSKGTAVTLPPVLLLLNVYPLRRLTVAGWRTPAARRVYAELLPFIVLGLAMIVMTFVALQPMPQLAPAQKVAVSAYSLAFYLWKTVAPSGLAPLYDMPLRIDPLGGVYVASYLTVIVVTALVLLARRRRPGLAWAWALFVLILFPLLGVHQNGPQIAADRYTYDAAPVLTIFVATGWAMWWQRQGKFPLFVAGAALLVLGSLTWEQAEIWHDSVSMWSSVLRLNPESSITLTALGNLEAKAGKPDSAIMYYERSLAIAPDSPEAENNLGIALSAQQRYGEALVHYKKAASLKASYYEAENNWGQTIVELHGDLSAAMEHFRRALGMNPDYADAHVNWGNALVLLGRFDEAIPHYQQAIRIRPDDADAYRNWGVALARQNKFGEAIERFRQALALRPDFPDASRLLERATQLLEQQSTTRPPRR